MECLLDATNHTGKVKVLLVDEKDKTAYQQNVTQANATLPPEIDPRLKAQETPSAKALKENGYSVESVTESGGVVEILVGKEEEDDIYYHYTDETGCESVKNTKILFPNKKNKTYITKYKFSKEEAFNNLFLANPLYKNKGDYVVAFKLTDYQIAQLKSHPSDPYELYFEGTLRIKEIIYIGKNTF